MKTRSALWVFCLLLGMTPCANAQSFLKKVGKAVEKAGHAVDKTVDNLLGTGESESQQQQQETTVASVETAVVTNETYSPAATPVVEEEVEKGEYRFPLSYGNEALAYFAANHVDDATRQELKIDQIVYKKQSGGDPESEDFNEYAHKLLREAPHSYIAKGPLFRRTGQGTIRRVYLCVPDEANSGADVYGFLISYDTQGNYVDSKLVNAQYGVECYGSYEGDKIRVRFSSGGEGWTETYVPQNTLFLRKTDYSGNPF